MLSVETQTCPKCGFPREPKAVDCPVCGIVFAKYEKTLSARSAVPAPAAPVTEPSTVPGQTLYGGPPPPPAVANPYAPPQASLTAATVPPPLSTVQTDGVWRSADILVLRKGNQLPGRCVACNQETPDRWQKTFYWAPPGLRFLILLNVIIYAIVMLVVRKRADLAVPLCPEHNEKRQRGTTQGWIALLVGIGFLIASFATMSTNDDGVKFGLLFLLGLALIITGSVLTTRAIPLQPKKIDDYYVWMKKASPELLATLPQAPPGL
jgi:hypothetical protein